MKTFYEINDAVEAGIYDNKVSYPKAQRYQCTHIFDEDKSVKWNKEQVTIENKKIEVGKKEYQDNEYELREKFKNDCITVLLLQSDFLTRKSANIIFDRAYTSAHSEGYTAVLSEIEDLLEFIEQIHHTAK